MAETIRFDDNLSVFQNVIMLYRDEEGKLYIGNTWFYNRPGDNDYMSVMYKEALPANMGVIEGWNWLDDNDPRVTLVPEKTMEMGVEDFLYAHGKEKNWKTVTYHVIESYPEIEFFLKSHPLENGKTVGFGLKK